MPYTPNSVANTSTNPFSGQGAVMTLAQFQAKKTEKEAGYNNGIVSLNQARQQLLNFAATSAGSGQSQSTQSLINGYTQRINWLVEDRNSWNTYFGSAISNLSDPNSISTSLTGDDADQYRSEYRDIVSRSYSNGAMYAGLGAQQNTPRGDRRDLISSQYQMTNIGQAVDFNRTFASNERAVIVNQGIAKDTTSSKERSKLDSYMRNKASEEASKRKTSFRNTTIGMGSNGLKIPNGTGS